MANQLTTPLFLCLTHTEEIMNKGIVSLFVDKNTTKEEIKKIRDEFKSDEYILNIVISGNGDFKNDLKNFLIQ